MMLFVKLIAFALLLCQIDCIKERQFSNVNNNVRQAAKLNSPVELNTAFEFAEKDITWQFEQNNDSKVDVIYQHYAPDKLKDPVQYDCLPDVNSCINLRVKTFARQNIGEYYRKGTSVDGKINTVVSFFVYGYESPIMVSCETKKFGEKCEYNPSTQTLTVKEGVSVTLSCYSNVVTRPGAFDEVLYMQHMFNGETGCQRKQIGSRNEMQNEQIFQVRNECERVFKKGDSLYQCALKKDTSDPDIELDSIDIKLNVKFAPSLNETEADVMDDKMTIKQGSLKIISCPYNGYPIEYRWTINGEVTLNTNKTLTVPNNLNVGKQQISCQAYIPGDMKTLTQPFNFDVEITKSSQSNMKKILIIAGSVVGGVILLAVIIIVVVKVIRNNKEKRPSRGPRNESGAEARPLK